MSELFFNAADLKQDGQIDFKEVKRTLAYHQRNFDDLFGSVDHAHNIISNLTKRETIYVTDWKVNKRFDQFGGRFSYAILPDMDDEEEEIEGANLPDDDDDTFRMMQMDLKQLEST